MIKTYLVVVLFVLIAGTADAENDAMTYPAEKIVDAIYLAEGGSKAQFLYGIRSVRYTGALEARQICLNTVRNQYKRHRAHTCGKPYMQCLADRYCPIGCDNDTGTNKYWLKNVMYFLTKGE